MDTMSMEIDFEYRLKWIELLKKSLNKNIFFEKTKNFYPKLKDEIHKSLEEIDTMFLDMEKKIRDNIDELYDSKGIIEMRMKLNKKK